MEITGKLSGAAARTGSGKDIRIKENVKMKNMRGIKKAEKSKTEEAQQEMEVNQYRNIVGGSLINSYKKKEQVLQFFKNKNRSVTCQERECNIEFMETAIYNALVHSQEIYVSSQRKQIKKIVVSREEKDGKKLIKQKWGNVWSCSEDR